VELKVKILHPRAIAPKYHFPDDSGFDMGPIYDVEVLSGCSAHFGTGIALELPPGTELQVRPRGSISKQGILIHTGTVDEGYRGEIRIFVTNLTRNRIMWPAGTRVAQGVIVPVFRPEFILSNELSKSARGSNGFGHTGER